MAVSAETVIGFAARCEGKTYRLGAAVPAPGTEYPAVFDCSSMVQWAHAMVGVTLPRNTMLQDGWLRQHGQQISTEQAMRTRGAVLMRHRDKAGKPVVPKGGGHFDYGAAHVGLSFGDGVHAYEARSSSSRPNCGLFATNAGSWTAAFLVPGVNYKGGVDVLPTEPGSDLHQRAIVDVRATRYDGSPARLGSLGWEVECIQFALTYFHEIVTDVDGDFGPQTHANVIEFQTGIRRSRPNGVVGRVEWVKLGLTSDRVA